MRVWLDGATGPCAGSRVRSSSPRTLVSDPRKSASGAAVGTGSKPIDGVMVGSTWSPANSSPAARSAKTKWPWVCPGVAMASRVRSPTSIGWSSSSHASG